MRIFFFVLLATVLEASGDAIVRIALHRDSLPARIGLFITGALFLTLYGTSLNLAPIDFAEVTGIYVGILFIVFQITNYVFFQTTPTVPIAVRGALIVTGRLIVGFWR